MRQLLIGTLNKHKADTMREVLAGQGFEIVDALTLSCEEAPETSDTPIGNAIQKAESYFQQTGIPCLGIDHALYIDGLPPEKQPGVLVRRITGEYLDDKQLLQAMCKHIGTVGDETTGHWNTGVCIQLSENKRYEDSYIFNRTFRSNPSDKMLPGAPLSSLTFVPQFGKYVSEFNDEERKIFYRGYADFLREFVRKSFGNNK